jgi:ssDNA-binding replication factor A large subunit
MTPNTPKLGELRPGMEHLNFKVKVSKKNEARKVKTFTGVKHMILEGEISDGDNSISFAVWNEKIELFKDIAPGDTVDLTDCFITSYKGVLQVNVGRDSNAVKVSA